MALVDDRLAPADEEIAAAPPPRPALRTRLHRLAMRPRRLLVRVHRSLSISCSPGSPS
jgi:hypothetical protein